MNKSKNILNFVLIVIIIGIYLLLLSNMNYFIYDYNNKIQEYDNKYEIKSESNKLFEYINLSTIYTTVSQEDLYMMQNNELIINILKKYFEMNREEVIKYIQQTKNMRLIPNTKYGDIIYLYSDTNRYGGQIYQLVFTKDFKNIYFAASYDIEEDTNIKVNVNQITQNSEDKNEFLEEVKRQMENLGLTNFFDFNPDTIALRKYARSMLSSLETNVYEVRDIKNNIVVCYDKEIDKIRELAIGFDLYDTY